MMCTELDAQASRLVNVRLNGTLQAELFHFRTIQLAFVFSLLAQVSKALFAKNSEDAHHVRGDDFHVL